MTGLPDIAMIWAQTTAGVIGVDGTMAWHIPEDFAHFKATTMGTAVVMGRKTWQSLPAVSRPLPGRTNIVITTDPNYETPGAQRARSLEQALTTAQTVASDQGTPTIWVIGGATVYAQAMERATRLSVTMINADIPGDAFAPKIDETRWRLISRTPSVGWQKSRTGLEYAIVEFARTENH